MAKSNRWMLWSGISCCLGLAVSTTWLGMHSLSISKASEGTPVAAVRPSARITAMGRIEPLHALIKLAAPSSVVRSRIKTLYVAEGDVVQKGQLIAELDVIDERRSALQIAERNLALERQRLRVVRGESIAGRQKLRQLQDQLANAERDLQRYSSLFANGALSTRDLDAAKLLRDNARQALEEQHAAFSSEKGQPGKAPLLQEQVSQAAIDLAEAQVIKARRELEQVMIHAPQNGTILKVLKHAGEEVDQKGMLLMGDTSAMVTVAEVYESDIKHLRIGQRVKVTSPALAKSEHGTVTSIGNLVYKNDIIGDDPSADVDTRVVEVRIRMKPSAELARMSRLQVNVEIQKS